MENIHYLIYNHKFTYAIKVELAEELRINYVFINVFLLNFYYRLYLIIINRSIF